MTVLEMKNQVMFQTNNDADDLADYAPHLLDYLNEGYDKLVYAWAEQHCVTPPTGETVDYPWLASDNNEPNLPEWIQRGIVDWATWLVYRNGNVNKQNRGYQYRTAFEELLRRIINEGGIKGKTRNFFNIPK